MNRRIAETREHLWRPAISILLLKQGLQEQVAQDSVQLHFECLQGWRHHSPSGQPVPPSQKKRLFLLFRWNLLYFSWCCAVTGCHREHPRYFLHSSTRSSLSSPSNGSTSTQCTNRSSQFCTICKPVQSPEVHHYWLAFSWTSRYWSQPSQPSSSACFPPTSLPSHLLRTSPISLWGFYEKYCQKSCELWCSCPFYISKSLITYFTFNLPYLIFKALHSYTLLEDPSYSQLIHTFKLASIYVLWRQEQAEVPSWMRNQETKHMSLGQIKAYQSGLGNARCPLCSCEQKQFRIAFRMCFGK